ncbi:sugar-transfer associated ATP-grasp domain-containing protein [Thauera humireducens]|uniref:sugar-transfer associated ATP-grasp domain-containing protein n=1 Tax=Thauera humireducens TaxID=1134435 RepID=UPI00311E2D0F
MARHPWGGIRRPQTARHDDAHPIRTLALPARRARTPGPATLSNTTGLQTVRVVTVVDHVDRVYILAARLRLICGDVAHDNFEFGKTGNVIAILNPENGRIESAVGGSSARYEMQPVTRHPRTGHELIGFEVPNWPAVRELAICAAQKFMPLRSIGWDVAVTPDTPTLIEGNVTWATLSGEARMGDIYRSLCELADTLQG